MKPSLFFADLTHTSQGVVAPTFPLGISFVASYALKELGPRYEYELFKFPQHLNESLHRRKPAFLCFSNFSWNFEMAYRFAEKTKARWPEVVTVFGGPNFPIETTAKKAFLMSHPAIDFHVEMEGELGFVHLIRALENHNLNIRHLKSRGEAILNTCYVWEREIVSGPLERIQDINAIPSPYLSGLLDTFFENPLAPMIETTRGCPFSCTFCADGASFKSKIRRFEGERTREELRYIAQRVKHSDEIILTDLNFGMFDHDLETCRRIAELQKEREWPILVKASAGKNKPERVIEAASILQGSWMIGSAIQSSDSEVLKAVKRGNISSDSFSRFIDYGNSFSDEALTYTDIILGLPADTREKHFESLRYSIEKKVNSLRMYQTVVLLGTELASPQSRTQYDLQTMHRVLPGCAGTYTIFGEAAPIAEFEEIIVSSSSLSFSDYVDCRKMNLLIETFYNNALFEEVFALLQMLQVPAFDVFLYLFRHPELQPLAVRSIVESFVKQTTEDLFPSSVEAKERVLSAGMVEKYVKGELGINELLIHKALLYLQLEATSQWLRQAVQSVLRIRGKLSPLVSLYLGELFQFLILRKSNITETAKEPVEYFHFDFKTIAKDRFRVDPNKLETRKRFGFRFFHDPKQKQHIEVQYSLYSKTATGLGRFIQRCNLKMMYRRFASVEPADNVLDISRIPHTRGKGNGSEPPRHFGP